MGVAYSIEPFGPEIVAAYARLFAGDEDKRSDVLNWRFRDNPHGEARFVITRSDGQIGGMIALVPTRLTTSTGKVEGWQAIDTIVDPDLRGKSAFVRMGKLAEVFVSGEGGILWGFPNASAARGWFGRLGWTRTGSVPFLIKPLRSGYLLRRLSPLLAWADVKLYRRPIAAAVSDCSSIDTIWPEFRGKVAVAVDRDPDWLKWRLAKPGAKYQAYSTSGNGSPAFAATRVERKHGGTIVYVMEAFAQEPGAHLASLIANAVAQAGDAGAEVALAWCSPSSPNYRSYRKAGFLPFPDRLRPIEIHHGYWQELEEGGQPNPRMLEPWYLSYLDSDTV